MNKEVVIGIDQSYTRTGITVLKNKQVYRMKSLDFKECRNNTEKRLEVYTYIETLFKRLLKKKLKTKM